MNSFVMMVFWMLTVLNSAGQLEPVSKRDLPPEANGPITTTEETCVYFRSKMKNPDRYVCQQFRSTAEMWKPVLRVHGSGAVLGPLLRSLMSQGTQYRGVVLLGGRRLPHQFRNPR